MKNKYLPITALLMLLSLFFAGTSLADIRKPTRFITKNGMTVLLLERKSLPFITVYVSVKAGSLFDPTELPGLGNMTAELLTEGTTNRSAESIAEEIDFVGGNLGSSGGIDYSSASLSILSKYREKGFDLLADILINPSFPESEIERIRSQIKAGIISKEDDPSTIAVEKFNKILFGRHPYSNPAEGNLDSIARIRRDDIQSLHKNFYRPNNTIMAVVGDIQLEELKRLLERYFGAWEKRDIIFPDHPAAKNLEKQTTEILDKDITQANIVLGHLGIKRENPDYHAVYVLNYILGGGGFVSRLMTEIRDNKGLAYSVYSYFNPLKEKGSFKIGLQTKNESAREAISEVVDQLTKLVEKGITEKELRDAKDYLIGSFPLKFTTNSKIAGYLTYMEVYNLGLDYLDRYPKIIETLTVDDINSAAKKYLNPENYLLVIVGDRDKMGDLPYKP